MAVSALLSESSMAGLLLILGNILTMVGIVLWTGRNIFDWQGAGSAAYLDWERGFVMAGMLGVVLGFVLTEGLLKAAGDSVWARLGLATLLVATALGMAAEATLISTDSLPYALIATYAILAFVGQAAFGLSLLRTGLLAGWIGWATILWNLGFLVALPIVSRGDIYYPFTHIAAPLLIGIALLVRR